MDGKQVKRRVRSLLEWEKGLISASISEENWCASVGMVIPASGVEGELVNWLLAEIKIGNRQRFKAITYAETIQMVEGGVAAVKSKTQSGNVPFTEVLTTAKASLTETGQLTSEIVARLIKFQIIIWKNESLKETASTTPKSEKSKSPKSSMLGIEPSRLNRLKYRSGEGPPVEVIGDEPCFGPHLYVMLIGFHDASLVSALEIVNVPLDTVIKVQLIMAKNAEQDVSNEDLKPFQLPGMIAAEKILNKTLVQFWKKFKMAFVYAEPSSQLHDVIFQDLDVLSSDVPSVMCCADIQNSFRAALFTNLAKLMYKIQDLKRQYITWLEHIEFVHIPSFEKQKSDFFQTIRLELQLHQTHEIPLNAKLVLPDTQHYKSLLENLPSECVTVPIVLHCMIEQVVETVEKQKQPVSEFLIKEEDDTLSTRLNKLFDKCMINYATPMQFLPPVNAYNPLLIYYGDDVRSTMHHVSQKTLDLENISNSLIKTHPIVTAVMEFPEMTIQQRNIQVARYQNFLTLFKPAEITIAEIDWALKLLSFESMVLQTSDFHGNINKPFQKPIPWDDPYKLVTSSAEVVGKVEDRNFPIVNNFTKGGRTVCCASESKTRLKSVSSKASIHTNFCNDSKDLIQCECMIKRTSPKFNDSSSNKSIITNARCLQCSKPCLDSNQSKTSYRHFTIARNLEDFNFVEYFPPDVFQQVLSNALEVLHCVDLIYYKRDPSHLLVLHNPFNSQKHCCMMWNTIINSNVNLRNFQLHVRPMISCWIDKQEAAYECLRRSQDSSGKRSVGDTEQTTSVEPQFSLAKLIGEPDWVPLSIQNSLKNKKFNGEGPSSPTVLTSFGQAELLKLRLKETSDKKKSKTDSESKKSRHESVVAPEAMKRLSSPKAETEFPFQGYDVGNLILHISGTTNYLYPGCKAQICVEKYAYTEGRQRIKITVFDEGNYLYVHSPIVERSGRWSESIKVVLLDGICVYVKRELSDLLLKEYSKTLESYYTSSKDMSTLDDESDSNYSGSEKSDEYSSSSSSRSTQIESPLWLTFTLPNNLIVQIRADSEQNAFLVRQFFYGDDASDELCRTITMSGNVIRTLKANRSEILQPDGSVLKTDWSLFDDVSSKESSKTGSVTNDLVTVTSSQLPDKESRSGTGNFKEDTLQATSSELSVLSGYEDEGSLRPSGPPWNVLTPSGRQFEVQLGSWNFTELDNLLAHGAVDSGTKEEYQAREDGLHIVYKRNRHFIAHHYEGTRITTFYERGGESTVDSIRVEKPPFVAVTANPRLGTFDVQLNQNFNLIVKPTGTCVIHQKNGTQFAFHSDGSLMFTPGCPNSLTSNLPRPFTTFVIYPCEETILESYDHFGQQFAVKSNGTILVSGVPAEIKEEHDLLNRRYFVAHLDGSGSEFLNENKVDEIMNSSVENSLSQIDVNLLPNNMYVEGFQIFNPMAKTCLDSWMTSYEMDSIVPSGLTSKDLQPIPPLMVRDRRYTFGKGVGNGLHVKPVGRLTSDTTRCTDFPQVWELRNFLKFRKMTTGCRDLFHKKLTELNQVLRKFDVQKQRAQVIDSRPTTEQQLSASLLALAKATGLPRQRTGKGLRSKSAGAEKSLQKPKVQQPTKKSDLFHVRNDVRNMQKHLKVYRTTNYLPPYFKCQLGKEALLKIKEMPKSASEKLSDRQKLKAASIEEKTPPLLKDTQARKQNLPSFYGKLSESKRDLEKKAPVKMTKLPKLSPFKLPDWADVDVFMPKQIKRAKFIVKPPQVDFGTVPEGTTLRHRVYLKNDGIENSAVRIRQPQKETGISVSVTPLLVMAGMQATMDVEIHALMPPSVNEFGEGRVYHELEIRTEIETIYLPITAKVVPGNVSATSNLF